MPAVGERVLALFHPEAQTKGCILGSYYSDNRLPPFGDENKTYVLFEDETLVEYDKASHKLKIKIPSGGEKSIDIFAESDINVETNGNINIKAAGNMTVNISGTTNIHTIGTTNITSATSVNVTAPVINLN